MDMKWSFPGSVSHRARAPAAKSVRKPFLHSFLASSPVKFCGSCDTLFPGWCFGHKKVMSIPWYPSYVKESQVLKVDASSQELLGYSR
jgi:hypothetical protein